MPPAFAGCALLRLYPQLALWATDMPPATPALGFGFSEETLLKEWKSSSHFSGFVFWDKAEVKSEKRRV